jgi:hypothetical protein
VRRLKLSARETREKTRMKKPAAVRAKKFPAEVIRQLKSYVYAYTDPRSGEFFYLGKGIGNRAFSHLAETGDSEKVKLIRAIRQAGHEPKIEIIRYGLTNAEAELVEAVAIDLLGRSALKNAVRGAHSRSFGRVRVETILRQFQAKPAKIQHKVILITINRLFRDGMTELELLEATRGIWKVGLRRERAELALAVYQGTVQEVFTIQRWHKAGTLEYQTRDSKGFRGSGRYEFEGIVAPEAVRKSYRHKSVRDYLAKGSQNPIRYVKC